MKKPNYVIIILILSFRNNVQSQQLAELQFVSLNPKPVNGKTTGGAENVKFGFEGGSCIKIASQYYLFTTENFGEPKTATTRLALYASRNGIQFSRVRQLAETNYNWNDTTSYLMSPWSPMAVFDTMENRWSVFYVGYRRKPGSPDVYNMGGRIRRLDAAVNGLKGITGPYKVGGWLALDAEGSEVEGSGETVSFSAFMAGKNLYGFLGYNTVPVVQSPEISGGAIPESKTYFRAALASADKISGKWHRLAGVNPVMMDDEFIENSIVTKINDHLYINLYDGSNKHEISYATSADGLHWNKEQLLKIPNPPSWLFETRTPLGLISEGRGIYTIYFTAFDGKNEKKVMPLWHHGYGNVGMIKVKLIIPKR